MLCPPDRAVVARPITAGAAPLTKQRTTGVPDGPTAVLKVAISLCGVEWQRGLSGQTLSSGFDVQTGLVGEYRQRPLGGIADQDRKSTRLNSSHVRISYAVFCLKKK